MKKPNPAHIEMLTRIINSAPYFQLLSMKLREIGVGYSLFETDLERKHHHPLGLVHGGFFASMIDSAASWAIFYGIEDENGGMTSVDLKLNYLAPAASGKVLARGQQIKVGKTLGYAEARVTDENGRLLAHGTLTALIFPGKAALFEPLLPPKFVE